MKKRSMRLAAISDLYSRQEHDARLIMVNIQQKLQDLKSQMANLEQYRAEYYIKVEEKQKIGVNVKQLLEFRAFAEKLDKAIDSQRKLILAQEQDFQKASKHWQECRQRTKSMEKLAELAQKQELKAENKLEQQEQDARAARACRKLARLLLDHNKVQGEKP